MIGRRFPRQPITKPTPMMGDFFVSEYVVDRGEFGGLSTGKLTLITNGKPYGDIAEFIGRTVRLVLK